MGGSKSEDAPELVGRELGRVTPLVFPDLITFDWSNCWSGLLIDTDGISTLADRWEVCESYSKFSSGLSEFLKKAATVAT